MSVNTLAHLASLIEQQLVLNNKYTSHNQLLTNYMIKVDNRGDVETHAYTEVSDIWRTIFTTLLRFHGYRIREEYIWVE